MTNLQNYFRSQQVALQWLPVLRAMAQEMSASAETADLHSLFLNIGRHFANNAADSLRDLQTLDQLEEGLNDFWWRLNWGWVELSEVQGYIEIAHHAAPLAEAFGEEALAWSAGLLEGFYQTVFTALGANPNMAARLAGETGDGMLLRFRFGL